MPSSEKLSKPSGSFISFNQSFTSLVVGSLPIVSLTSSIASSPHGPRRHGVGPGHEPGRLRVGMGHARTAHRTLPRPHQPAKTIHPPYDSTTVTFPTCSSNVPMLIGEQRMSLGMHSLWQVDRTMETGMKRRLRTHESILRPLADCSCILVKDLLKTSRRQFIQ